MAARTQNTEHSKSPAGRDRGRTYEVGTDWTEEREILSLTEAEGGTVIPDRLLAKQAQARVALAEAEADIIRWIKYSGTDEDRKAAANLIAGLPRAEDRRRRR